MAARATAHDRVKTVVSFDPGMINLAVWKGYVDENDDLHTDVWIKMDITKYDTQRRAREHVRGLDGMVTNVRQDVENHIHGSKGMYALISNILSIHAWMYTDVDVVIIETQEPNNIPTRMIAASLYSFMRAKFVDEPNKVQFSGNSSKMKMKIYMANAMQMPFDPAQCVGTAKSARAYKKTKSTSYAICKQWMLKRGSEYEQQVVNKYCEKTGRLKGDDLAEAYLLGAAELLKKRLTGVKTAADRYDGEDDDYEYQSVFGGDYDRDVPCIAAGYRKGGVEKKPRQPKQRRVGYDVSGFMQAVGVSEEDVIRNYVSSVVSQK